MRRLAQCVLVVLLAMANGACSTPSSEVPTVSITEAGTILSPGSEVLGLPVDIQVAPDRNELYVLDDRSKGIQRLGLDGSQNAFMGRKGQGPGEFIQPAAFSVGPDNQFYVVDAPTGRVQVLARSGEYLDEFTISAARWRALKITEQGGAGGV